MMKLNCLLVLPFLAIMAGGCASTPHYHGPEYFGSPENLPPMFWDSVLNGGETSAPLSATSTCDMGRRET